MTIVRAVPSCENRPGGCRLSAAGPTNPQDVGGGLPWQSIGAFLRIATHPRVTRNPLSTEDAWGYVQSWLDADPTWVPPATGRTAAVLARLMRAAPITGNLVTDAQLAALAIEHGLVVLTADTDFARFAEVRWTNPLLG